MKCARRAFEFLAILAAAVALTALVVYSAPRAVGAEPPKFVVENRMPAFDVSNRMPPKTVVRVTEYQRVYDRVRRGERVTVTVTAAGFDGLPPGLLTPGTWELVWERGGLQAHRKEVKPAAAPPFPAASASIPTTSATAAGRASFGSPVSTPTAPTPTFVLGAGIPGVTNGCPPSG